MEFPNFKQPQLLFLFCLWCPLTSNKVSKKDSIFKAPTNLGVRPDPQNGRIPLLRSFERNLQKVSTINTHVVVSRIINLQKFRASTKRRKTDTWGLPKTRGPARCGRASPDGRGLCPPRLRSRPARTPRGAPEITAGLGSGVREAVGFGRLGGVWSFERILGKTGGKKGQVQGNRLLNWIKRRLPRCREIARPSLGHQLLALYMHQKGFLAMTSFLFASPL